MKFQVGDTVEYVYRPSEYLGAVCTVLEVYSSKILVRISSPGQNGRAGWPHGSRIGTFFDNEYHKFKIVSSEDFSTPYFKIIRKIKQLDAAWELRMKEKGKLNVHPNG